MGEVTGSNPVWSTMKNFNYVWQSLLAAAGTVVYVSAVAWLMTNAERWFGGDDKTVLNPIIFLLMFVISATVTGSLVLGRPIHLYLSGLKREAFIFLGSTLGWLVLCLVVIVLVLFNVVGA